MWNSFNTADYSGMVAETITLRGKDGTPVRAYYSRPITNEPHPSIVLIPHMPGWDELCRELSRRYTEHGYSVICPNIFQRFDIKTPREAFKTCIEAGGLVDADVMGDVEQAIAFLKAQPLSNGKAGVIGMCSGGRHAFLAACTVDSVDAAVDCWGGGVFAEASELTPARPKAPIDFVDNLHVPLLGIFGNDDQHPSPDEVNRLEEELRSRNKDYEFHRYDGAGHGFWSLDRGNYRVEAAMDSFNRTLDFFGRTLK